MNAPLVLVTGCAGNIGSVLVPQLLDAGYRVRGVDACLYGDAALQGFRAHPAFAFLRGDLRDADVLTRAVTSEVFAVVHLAALVGDPVCARYPALANAVNWDASVQLLDRARQHGVERFLFASTCSSYGKMVGEDLVDETSALRPVSLYARLKVQFEERFLAMPRGGCATTSLRFATVYGVSPRIRFDLTVNEFTKELALGRELAVYGSQFWRPYCHVVDIARACVIALRAPRAAVDHEVFNVGDTQENYTKQMIVDALRAVLPDARVRYVTQTEDPRDYRVDFSKIARVFQFQVTRRVPDGIAEMLAHIRNTPSLDVDAPVHVNAQLATV